LKAQSARQAGHKKRKAPKWAPFLFLLRFKKD